jgi:threonyl-tRNA synthetase
VTVVAASSTVVRVAAGESAGTAVERAGATGVAVVRDGEGRLRDLAWVPAQDAEVELVPLDSEDGRAVLRHSTAHVMAQAVQELFPGTVLGIGPPVENGFYYDFGAKHPFTPQDLLRIEKRMRKIVAQRQRFVRRVVSDDSARIELDAEPFKLELISLKGSAADQPEGAAAEVGGAELTMYDNVRPDGHRVWTDLCRGPHVPTTADIPAFKLMRVAAAYWRGDERNPQLQRIYGTAWESQDALDAYLEMLEQAAARDHRKLGTELDLFSFPPSIGGGLAVWHPKGGVVRRVMEEYSRQRHEQAGYEFVVSPHLAKAELFETSGHLQWYAEGMYPPMEMEGASYYPKPMNCPFHILIYSARGRSYRDLPLRMFELGTVYRFEKSGVLHGLTRARGFTQDDSHIFCTPDQLAGELTSLLRFVIDLLRDFGLTDFEAELSTRPEKYVGERSQWDEAEAALRTAIDAAGVPYVVAEGEGAFYAPKIDVHIRDAIGRRWQLSTLQVDLQLPVRFDLEYQDSDGQRHRPYMIHRALFGSVERFFAILLEHYAGVLPPWLAPVTAVAIPVSDDAVPHLESVVERLREKGVRAEVDASGDRMQKKIRNAQAAKVPFMVIAGGRDVESDAVSFRYRDGSQRNGIPVDLAVAEVVAAVADRRSAAPVAVDYDEG